MTYLFTPMCAALCTAFACNAWAQTDAIEPLTTLEPIKVSSGPPSSLPMQIPTTMEGITGKKMQETVNAFDSEDALKYFPSLNVRKRYIGDFDHAVLASRASGTGNSARSMVYADGILLSNFLGNGAAYTPRWGLVSPEEIERVDVLYGPFSAAYPGNSVGAVVDYVTRMPKRFEGHAKVSTFSQKYEQYGTNKHFTGTQASAALGNKSDAWSWWLDLSRLRSNSQPIAFANKLTSTGTPGTTGTAVTGAVLDQNPKNQEWLILGDTNQIRTTQDHLKFKLAYDFSPAMQMRYTLGWWKNQASRQSNSYLRDTAGNAVYAGNINVSGRQYALNAADFSVGQAHLEHLMQGLSLKSNTKGLFDWEVATSAYDYAKDTARTATTVLPDANGGGAGRITDLGSTGWNTLALKGTWRPSSFDSAHVIDFGYQREHYKLRTTVSDTPDWLNGNAAAKFSAFNGDSTLNSLWGQDTWRLNSRWKTTLGARLEQWRAFGGELANANTVLPFEARRERHLSPKAAVAWQATPQWAVKASLAKAVRMPTVAELYQGTVSNNTLVNNDPNLKPEKSWTSELSAERQFNQGTWRTTVFRESTRDALYSQTNVTVSPNVTNIQNIGRIRTMGLEMAYQGNDVIGPGIDLSTSMTYARSHIVQNDQFPASIGKWQPRVPQWRANLMATYRPNEQATYTIGTRYSGKQYGTLDNIDPNGATYTGVSRYWVTDVRMRHQFSKHWGAALGIDNLNNTKYWAFHPYTQRTFVAELKFDH
jgi:iron complex outermembrane recepter protein